MKYSFDNTVFSEYPHQEEKELTIRPEVAAFAEAMEERLRANDYKGGWSQCNIQWLFTRLLEEAAELNFAIYDGSRKIVLIEAADVANFAMMIADVVGALVQKKGAEQNA